MDIFIIVGLFLLVTAFLPWINWGRISNLRQEVEDLRAELRALKSAPAPFLENKPVTERVIPTSIPEATPAPEFIDMTVHEPLKAAEIRQSLTPPPAAKPAPEKRTAKTGIEFNVGAKLPVWIGAVSLIFAAFFLVKYSLESGLLGPAMRVSLGMLFGMAMTAAGHFLIRRPHIANHERIAQGLTGAGIVSLYGCIYAAVNLYGMISPAAGFVGMCAVTAVAVVAALRIGQPIALFALIGGLLTPALLASEEPNSIILFAYLYALFAGFSFVMIRKGWWTLSLAALLGIFGWTTVWILMPTDSGGAVPPLVMQLATVLSILKMAQGYLFGSAHPETGDSAPADRLVFVALGGTALTVVALSFKITMGLFDWAVLGLLGAALIALTAARPSTYRYGLWAMLALHLCLYAFWLENAAVAYGLFVLAGSALLYVVVPQYLLMRKSAEALSWSGIQLAASGALFALAVHHYALDANIAAILSLIAAGLCIAQLRWIFRHENFIDVRDGMAALYSFAASAFLSAGAAFLLPHHYLATALALQVLGTLWITTRIRIKALDGIAAILTVAAVLLHTEQVLLFLSLIVNAVIDETVPQTLDRYLLPVPLLTLGLPSAALLTGAYIRAKAGPMQPRFFALITATGIAAGLACLYYLIRGLYHDPLFFSVPSGFIERAGVSFVIAAPALGLAAFGRGQMRRIGAALFHLFLARIVFFDLLIDNPYLDDAQKVGTVPLLNGITLTYPGALGVLVAFARLNRGAFPDWMRKAYGAIALLLLIAFVSLTIRHFYHGDMLSFRHGMESAELYTYSVVWLLTGIGLLSFGMIRNIGLIRTAAFGVICLTVLKVFLIDAAHLEGLTRVFSFLGLGVSLIGLSYFYTKFIGSAKDDRP